VDTLKKHVLEEKYLLSAGYEFIIPDVDTFVNSPPPRCIAIYRAAFLYELRFPLYPVIIEILNKYDIVPA